MVVLAAVVLAGVALAEVALEGVALACKVCAGEFLVGGSWQW